MSVATRPDRHDAARRFRRRTATAAAAWSIAVTLVALVIVGVAVFGGGRPTIEAGLGSGAASDSPLRDRIATELGPLLAEPLSGIWAAYRDRAVLWGALALVVVGAASAAIGWWFADDCSAIPPPSVALGASSPRERPPRSLASSSRCPPAGRADRDGSDRAADCHGGRGARSPNDHEPRQILTLWPDACHASECCHGAPRWWRRGEAMDQVTQPSRFYDVATGGPVQVQIEQVGAVYRLVRQFGYRDPGYQKPFIVPDDVDTFTTDLASIPWMFAWLVPGLGTHLPAVLLHDGLVVGRGQPPTHIGPEVNRVEADRILRDAMASLGTPRLRRWLMWTGVTFATCWSDVPHRWWWRVVMPVTLGLVALLGVLATLDLADVWDVLPWMGDRAWWVELASGAAFALLIPLVFSVLWLQFWRAGAIAGVALAFLLHVTAAVVVVYGIYRVAERLASASEGTGPDVNENLRRATATAGDGQVPAPGP